LPETFPHISFNAEGVCNFCQSYKGDEKLRDDKAEHLEKFKQLVEQERGKSDYDCTLSFSGGKDSSYTLYILRKVFNLRVLALVLDNGFLSDQALKNIHTLTENLGADCQIFKPNFEVMKKIFKHAVDHPMYSLKTLERASTMCTSCIAFVKFVFLKIAIEKKIPLMAWGWSPGQAPIRSSIMKLNPALFKMTQAALKKPMQEIVGDDINPYFLNEEQFKDAESFPYSVSPLAFMEYDEKKIVAKLESLGWQAPSDVDGNSTNCLLNSLSNQIHLKRYNFHPYAFEIAEMVRSGVMTREHGLKKLSETGDASTVEYAKNKLGLND